MLELFLTFAKIGLFTFGGGYAMISLIEDACVSRKKWITHEELMNIVVIAESTPGPIAINCATYVGYRRFGFWGAVVATLGIVLPSFCIIFAISRFLEQFLEITVIANAFRGIRLAVGILILNAALNMLQKMKKKPLPIGILLAACCILAACHLLGIRFSSIWLMLGAGAVSAALFALKRGGRA